MGLEVNNGKATFVNIKEGKLYTKEKGKDPVFFDSLSGVLNSIRFEKDNYQGKDYEKAIISLTDNGERYVLQMRVDSGYFRGFCNSLKSGNPAARIKVAPKSTVENDRPKTTFFVEQNGKALKHYHTQANMGDLPQVKEVMFKGKKEWDGTEQIEYWKNWLLSLKFDNVPAPQPYKPVSTGYVDTINNPATVDDLPF